MTSDKLLNEVAEALYVATYPQKSRFDPFKRIRDDQKAKWIIKAQAAIAVMQKQIDELVEALEIISNGSSILDAEIAYKALTNHQKKGE